MRIALLALCLIAASACSQRQEQPRHDRDPNLASVTDDNAPTVKELIKQNYVVVDGLEVSQVCGKDCIAHGFSDIYLGKEGVSADERSLAEYACPGTDAPRDDWKCRALRPPYLPNGGLKPKS